ncbi:MAG TPA: hypothetical protein VGX25_00995 [Actinophytocola sp.]|uniref:hypothetical protein n=1 Tax=Actinophytocola sp. TaxID=1872138 RepID=UPI002DDCB1D2|nr:hypothetical protein [Actinophytocola sp.]HEV2777953.1 hypothetical protein [Actinophytocola sp.]
MALLLIAAGPWLATNRWCRLVALVAVLGLGLVHQLMFASLAEDAFISFRYAMNLAEGNGLVFNVGERVEGYSNFLWVLLIAAPRALFDADIVLVARVLGIGCALGCVVPAYLLAGRIAGGSAGVLAAAITAASSSLAAYGPSGLETPLFALLVLATLVAALSGRTFSAGLLVALATMTRPDGVVVAVLLGLWLIIQPLRGRARWHAPVLFVAGAVLLAGPWTLWRLDYYRYFLPNALAAKSGMPLDDLLDQGWRYLTGFREATWALLILVPLAILAQLVRWRRIPGYARGPVWLVLILAIGQAVFVDFVGGDWMPGWRLLAPVMPLLAVGLAATCVLVRGGDPDRRTPVADRIGPILAATVSAQLLVASVYNPSMKGHFDAWKSELYEMSSMGAWVHRTLPPGTVIATYANGALSYEAGPRLTVVDVLGLTDEHIARRGKRLPGAVVGHAAYDYAYVVNVRKPDIIFMRGNGFSLVPACDFMPELKDHYQGVVFRVAGKARWAPVYVRKERADSVVRMLDADPDFDRARCPA